MKAQKLNWKQARWTLYLSRFNFILNYVLESKIEKANSLSRRSDWEVGVERDNENKMLVKPEWLEVRRTEVVEIIVEGVNLLEKVKQLSVKDDEVVKAIEKMKWAGVKMLRDKEWREVDSVMYKEEKVYILKNDKLRAEIVRLYYDMPVEGHGGITKGHLLICDRWFDTWIVQKSEV